MTTELTDEQIRKISDQVAVHPSRPEADYWIFFARAAIAADRAARIGEFPALPPADFVRPIPGLGKFEVSYWKDGSMRAYAAQAVEADRAARGVPDVKTEIEFIQLITQMLVEINPNNYTDDDVSACVHGTIAALNALAVRENTLLAAAPQPAARGVPSAPDPSDPADIIAGALSISRGHAIEMMRQAVKEAQPAAQPCPTCESLAMAVMMDQTAHDMNLVAEKYAHKLALDLECVLADYSGKWWDAAIKTIGDYRSAMNAIHERESPTFMGEPGFVVPRTGVEDPHG